MYIILCVNIAAEFDEGFDHVGFVFADGVVEQGVAGVEFFLVDVGALFFRVGQKSGIFPGDTLGQQVVFLHGLLRRYHRFYQPPEFLHLVLPYYRQSLLLLESTPNSGHHLCMLATALIK